MRNKTENNARRRAIRIVSIYFIIGCIWIVTTDVLSKSLFDMLPKVYEVSIIKGLFYVLITALILYFLIYNAFKKIMDSEKQLIAINQDLELSNAKYMRLYQELEEKQNLLQSLIDSTEDWIFYKDNQGRYIGCNSAFEKFAGIEEKDLIGRSSEEIFKKEKSIGMVQSDMEVLNNEKTIKYEMPFTYPDGREVVVELIKTIHHDKKGKAAGLICVGRDITERKKEEKKIEYISCHDALTGLFNRSYLESQRMALDTAENLPISVIVCDVDGLKLINDAFGHAAGDQMLIKAANLLNAACKEKDVAIRTGGDEFCAFFPRTGSQEIEEIFEKINENCEQNRIKTNSGLQFTSISLGYATKETQDDPLEQVVLWAEDFMYRRKLLARKSAHSMLMKSITATLHEKSFETQEHCSRMSDLSRRLGQAVKVPARDLDTLELAASLHDVGKISVDLSILQKPGKLTEEEWEVMKKHPEAGWRITQAIPELNLISDIILSHHERWDGKGYPQGLASEEIPLLARIISIVDAYDAMIEERPYRTAMSPDAAKEEILKMAGSQFDENIAKIFVNEIL